MLQVINPYESPQYSARRPLSDDRPWINGVRISHVDEGFLYRRLVVEAPLALILEYHGNTVGETVSIDGQVACRGYDPNGFWFAPRLSFTLRSDDRDVPVVVEVRIGWSLKVKAFRVSMDSQTVYSEGAWQSAVRPK